MHKIIFFPEKNICMCAYPTQNFQTCYPFYLALSHSQAAKAEIRLGLLPVSPVFAWACSQSPQSPPSLTRAFAWACSQSHQSLCLGLLPVSLEPLPGLAPSLTRAFAWAQGWAQNASPPEFTGGIYRYFPAWQIRLKWQILASNGKYNFFAAKYWQI